MMLWRSLCLLLGLVMLVACTTSSDLPPVLPTPEPVPMDGPLTAGWEEGFTLRLEEAVLLPDNSRIAFVGVVEDTRCPMATACLQSGSVVVRFLMVDPDGSTLPLDLTMPEYTTGEWPRYEVVLQTVNPYPEIEPPPADRYEVTLFVRLWED